MPELHLVIDPDRLDIEWQGQSVLVHEWAIAAADAQAELDRAKSTLEVIKAELANEVREDPGSFGLAKVTEASISTIVLTQPEHRAAVEAVTKTRHALEITRAAVTALEHRKRALSLLVELWIKDYYSSLKMKGTDDDISSIENAKPRRRSRNRRVDRQSDEGIGD